MPGYDGTGPEGQGPMTGGARGTCDPQGAYDPRFDPYAGNVGYRRFFPGFRPIRRVFGRPRWGLRRGGRGRGRGRW